MKTATSVQTVPGYTPTDAEIAFVEAINKDERDGKVPQGVASQIECIVLRKMHGITLTISNEARAYILARAKEFGVTLHI